MPLPGFQPQLSDSVAAFVLLGGGLLACFAGYRLFKVVLGVYGFILGALFATQVVGRGNDGVMLVAGLVGGVIGSLLLVAVYFLGVALVGAAAGVFLAQSVWAQLGHAPNLLVILLFATLGMVLALIFQRIVIIIATAFGGAWTAIVGAAVLMGERVAARGHVSPWKLYPFTRVPNQQWVSVVALVLGVIGLIVQFSGPSSRLRSRR